MWEAGFRCMTTKKPVNAVADVKGMKLSIAKSEMYVWIWSTLGANPTVMALGEVYIGLQQGVIDGQENPSGHHLRSKIPRSGQEHLPDTVTSTPPFPLSTNEKMWQKLDKPTQEAILKAAREAQQWHREVVIREDEKLLSEMAAKGATIINRTLPGSPRPPSRSTTRRRAKYGKDLVDGLVKAAEEIKQKYPRK